MPRLYKKKFGIKGKCNYSKEYVKRAVAAVRRGGMSIRRAAESYGIPYSTVQRRFHGTHSLKYGRQPVLTDEEERRVCKSLQMCAHWGFPLRSTDVRETVRQYLEKMGKTETRFKNNLPGIDWFVSFMRRHPQLTIKLAENTKRVRASLKYETIEEYFNNLSEAIRDVPPSNIVNYDETNFTDDCGAVKVVSKRGSKHTYRTIDTSKTSTTVMFAIAADGTMLAPYIVYKAKHMYDGWTEGGFEGSRYNRSLSGWFDAELFEDWFLTIALPYFRKLDGARVMIGDNLNSHLTIGVLEACEANNIKFVLLPPNATHLLQPLDVAYFRPLKACWRMQLNDWKIKNRGVLPKTLFPKLLNDTITKVGLRSRDNAMAGFRATGISPFDPMKVLRKLPRNENNPENDENDAWSQAIIGYLETLKASGSQQKRGKKVNIPPGKSIAVADIMIQALTDKEPTRHEEPSNDSDSEILQDNDESTLTRDANGNDSESSIDTEETETTHQEESLQGTNYGDLQTGDYIIAKFPVAKRVRFYVGKIESISDEGLTLNVLRKKGLEKGYFVYPQIQDISEIDSTQFHKKVTLRSIKRGQHVFAITNKEFSILE